MRPVNLLPQDATATRRRLPSAPIALAAVLPFLAAALVYLGWSVEHGHVTARTGELAAVQARIDAIRPAAPAADRLASLRTARMTALDDALAKRIPWDATLVAIARVLPSDVWLNQLSLQSPTPVAGASTASSTAASSTVPAVANLQLTGSARSQAAVAHALARLALVPSLTDVTLGFTASAPAGTQKTVVQFQISAAVGAGS